MRGAAIKAGLPNIRTVSEPEAGAMFSRYNEDIVLDSLDSEFSGGNAPFLVADCGGGSTV